MTDHKNRDDLEALLVKAAEETEDQLDFQEPPLSFFEAIIEEQTEIWYRKLWFELICLWAVSFVLIGILTISAFYIPILFIAIQVLSFVILISYFYKENKETVLLH
ncbi:YxlC family protein [Halobacillus litoralis]|uniref:YxlC family protein n=1 Tax=Halobacillus litoralis TaxID=45668 RepID=UPI001CFED780|nr:YxlC family protein [Halobacillus litoralis]